MNKVLSVIRRELMERVRTRAFILSTFLMPIFLIAVLVLPAVMMSGGERSSRIALVDGTGTSLGAAIDEGLRGERLGDGEQRFEVTMVPAGGRVDAVRDSLVALTGFSAKERPDGFEGVLVVTPETYTSGTAHYLGSNAGSPQQMQDLSRTLSRVLMRARLDGAGVDQSVVAQALVPARLDADRVSDGKPTGQSGMASFAIAYAMGFLLYIVILLYGQQTAMSVIEEKTSRIMEVLASSLTPFQMLLGKIVGVGLTGLLQLSIWALCAYLLASQRGTIAGVFGADPDVVNAIAIPPIPADLLVIFLAYFALGFLIYGAMYATIGSLVNSMQDMQQFIWPVMLPIIIGFFGMIRVTNDPNAAMGTVFSFIPFFAPFVAPVKWAMGSMSPVELAISLFGMVVGVVVIAWLAGRIYRTGILMYGKKPTFGEIFRWVKAG
ncbi:MAG: ABC transporter permease [Gemmatimonadales bacterium]